LWNEWDQFTVVLSGSPVTCGVSYRHDDEDHKIMSRKHYRQLAEVIRTNLQLVDEASVAKVARDLADVLKRDNSAFRYDTFFAACGLSPWGAVSS
jgi:diaminopimelate decarboxylase